MVESTRTGMLLSLAAERVYLMTGKSSRSIILLRFLILDSSRLYTNELIKGVPGHTMSGFKTEESAQVHYTANRHLVHVIRTVREDDDNFGPIEDAYDVNWRGYVQGFDIA